MRYTVNNDTVELVAFEMITLIGSVDDADEMTDKDLSLRVELYADDTLGDAIADEDFDGFVASVVANIRS